MGRRRSVPCPVCGELMRVTSSRVSDGMRMRYLTCDACGQRVIAASRADGAAKHRHARHKKPTVGEWIGDESGWHRIDRSWHRDAHGWYRRVA